MFLRKSIPLYDVITIIFLLIRVEREANIPNICSRRYQAPELIFGVKNIQHPLIYEQLVVSLLSFFWARLSIALAYCWPKLTWVKEYLLLN